MFQYCPILEQFGNWDYFVSGIFNTEIRSRSVEDRVTTHHVFDSHVGTFPDFLFLSCIWLENCSFFSNTITIAIPLTAEIYLPYYFFDMKTKMKVSV